MVRKSTQRDLELRIRELKREASMRKGAEKELQERLNFERMFSDLSAKFVNLPNQQVDEEIEHGLKLTVESLGIDRSSVAQFSSDMKTLKFTHTYAAAGVPAMPSVILNEQQPWYTEKIRQGKTVVMDRISDLPDEALVDKKFLQRLKTKSNLIIPLAVGGSPLGLLGFGSIRKERTWSDELVQRLKLVGEVFANALMRQRTDQELHRAFSQIKELKDQLEAENIYLREEMDVRYSHEDIVGQSAAIKSVLSRAEQVAHTDSTVLISGETGTGKELLARAIHNLSSRKGRAMVKVNCAALPPTLVESELFGREKGAYTGASSRQLGRFEMANGATIFLDEISELPLELQTKLLRVLQEGQFERLGSPTTIKVNVRVIAATNQNISEAVRQGRFREDLFYRLNVFPISMPPLRDRLEDVPLLVWTFVNEFAETMGKSIERIPRRSMDSLMRYPWPGNVRELRNIIERAVILSKGSSLNIELPKTMNVLASNGMTLKQVERSHIVDVLNKAGWRVSGKKGAAEILGLKPTTLESRMKKLGIKRKK